MTRVTRFDDSTLPQKIKEGAVGVIPTDTLYGLVASVLDPKAVQRVYDLKQREASKPCIVLIDRPERALEFGVPEAELEMVAPHWPGPLSVVFSKIDDRFAYLRRDIGEPPFRVPDDEGLRAFLAKTGPLIAPSANLEGQPPVKDMPEITEVFGDKIDFAVDGGEIEGPPSTLVKINADGSFSIIRQGAVHFLA